MESSRAARRGRAILSIDNTIFAWQQPDLTRATTNQPRTIGIEYQTKF